MQGRRSYSVSPSGKKRVVIVTGASRGLGKELALCFGSRGDRVIVNYLSQEQEAAAVVSQIMKNGGEAVAARADIRDSSDMHTMVEDAVQRWGGVDVLVNNAAVVHDGLLLRMTEQAWDDVVGTNLTGPYRCIRAVSRLMAERRSGHIISIASIVGVQGREGQANYASAKAGLIGLTKACAREFGEFDVCVNAVLPGYLRTDMGRGVSDTVLERILKENALKRGSDPREVADFVHYLSMMKNVSGQIFNLDSRIL